MTEAADLPNSALPVTAMLGVGNMAGAILAGLRAPGVHIARPIRVTVSSPESAARFAGAADVVAAASGSDATANPAAVAGAKIVVLGVKPWLVREVAAQIAPALEPDAVVVSLAAGVPIAAIAEVLPAGQAIVRAMPNTPAHVGMAVTGLAAGEHTSAAQLALARALFETVGSVVVVPEERINAVTAISGSGPAYVYYVAEQLIAAAEGLGFSAAEARQLVVGTFAGASRLMVESGEDPSELRRRVTSPKGTTEQAVRVFEEAGLGEIFARAAAANVRRSEEIERGE